ncbi:MAG: membrane-bound lytic murein transglycosylase MltF [Gammaproteobacteria bacterium]
MPFDRLRSPGTSAADLPGKAARRRCSWQWLQRAAAACSLLAATGCEGPPSAVEAIRATGEIRVATVVSGTTLQSGPYGNAGFEHALASAFAARLGVTPRFVLADDPAGVLELVRRGKAHVGAALLMVVPTPSALRYGPTYAVGRMVVVQRRGGRLAPDTMTLSERRGAAIAAPGMQALLQDALPPADGHDWALRQGASAEDLLQAVDDGTLDYAVVLEHELAAARNYYPELVTSLVLGPPRALAWAYRPGPEDSLWRAQLDFLRALRADGTVRHLGERYLGAGRTFDYVDSRALLRHYEERLPTYMTAFETAATATGIDWRLLAAMAYQESRWRADARSPTGVRGLMMLTRQTAARVGVDRLDPFESIQGGARYLAELRARLPARIEEADRNWLALAAYNIGPSHLEDARVLAARAGADADSWQTVRRFLPRLGRRTAARKTRHGFARGHQAVQFVRNVRRYYDVIRWLDEQAREPTAPGGAVSPPPLVSPVF